MECSTAEGRIWAVAKAEAEDAQNNLFWWSRKISRPWLLPTDKEGVTSPKTKTRKTERTFSGRNDGEGDEPDHGHEPPSHPASTDDDWLEVDSTVPSMNKFLTEQMDIFPAETHSSGDLGTSWEEASIQNKDAPAPLAGWGDGTPNSC